MWDHGLKRICDCISAITLLVLLAPLIGVLYVLIRVVMGTPVIFRQPRIGRGQRVITVFKFRTMTDARDEHGELLPDSERLTSLGKLLRKTSLDELPQLWNVLTGTLSFIGPRPLLVKYLPYYSEREQLRHTVRPGISGWAQVHGRNQVSWDERLAYDVWYVEHCGFWLDVTICWLTLLAVCLRKGVVVDTRSTRMLDLDEERQDRAPVSV